MKKTLRKIELLLKENIILISTHFNVSLRLTHVGNTVYLLCQAIKYTPEQLYRQVQLLFRGQSLVTLSCSERVILPPLFVVTAQELSDESIDHSQQN